MKKFHPLAEVFPLMKGKEFDELVADIKAHGLCDSIVLLDDEILDGRNRARACNAAGIEPTYTTYHGDDPAAYVISCNVHRRHLTGEQKRQLIGKVLEANPEKSDRQLATVVKVDHKTVATVRKEKEGRGEIPHVEVRTDSKGRKQPAPAGAPAVRTKKRVSVGYRSVHVRSRALQAENRQLKNELETDSLIVAWDKAGRKQRHDFVVARKIEIMHAQQEVGRQAHRPDDEDHDGLDIPDCLRRVPKEGSAQDFIQYLYLHNSCDGVEPPDIDLKTADPDCLTLVKWRADHPGMWQWRRRKAGRRSPPWRKPPIPAEAMRVIDAPVVKCDANDGLDIPASLRRAPKEGDAS